MAIKIYLIIIVLAMTDVFLVVLIENNELFMHQ
jgi:hypothetical protein